MIVSGGVRSDGIDAFNVKSRGIHGHERVRIPHGLHELYGGGVRWRVRGLRSIVAGGNRLQACRIGHVNKGAGSQLGHVSVYAAKA